MVEHETSVFMRFFRKYFVFGSKLAYLISCWKNEAPNWRRFSSVASKLMPLSGAGFLLWHQNWCHFEYLLTYSQWEQPFSKVFLKKSSNNLLLRGNPFIAPSLTPCLKAILWTPSLIPSGKGSFLSSFQKNFRSLNPHLETVLSTYPAKISPTIPYSNFCGWKTTRFMKKFPTPLYRNFRSQKTKHFPNLFQKNVLTPLPHVFEPKTEALLQKTFSTIYHTFSGKKRTRFSKKVSYSYTACFFRRI